MAEVPTVSMVRADGVEAVFSDTDESISAARALGYTFASRILSDPLGDTINPVADPALVPDLEVIEPTPEQAVVAELPAEVGTVAPKRGRKAKAQG
jgi:hypothetical protein